MFLFCFVLFVCLFVFCLFVCLFLFSFVVFVFVFDLLFCFVFCFLLVKFTWVTEGVEVGKDSCSIKDVDLGLDI